VSRGREQRKRAEEEQRKREQRKRAEEEQRKRRLVGLSHGSAVDEG
jgi:hypothetical protein